MAEQIWGIADKVLGAQQKQTLQSFIHNWREKHPDQVNVETVRLSAFSYENDLAANEQKEIGGLFASVQQPTEAADTARLFAERALYYAERAPTLLRLQAKLGTHEIMDEIVSSLTEFPASQAQKAEITDLLRELQKTLQITRATFSDANDTVNSVSHLFEQQAGRPDVGRGTTETLTQLTMLLREWNQMVTSPRYQSGVTQMAGHLAGLTSNLEQASNRLLIRLAELGVGLIVPFWVMALLSKLAILYVSNSLHRRETESHEQTKDKAA